MICRRLVPTSYVVEHHANVAVLLHDISGADVVNLTQSPLIVHSLDLLCGIILNYLGPGLQQLTCSPSQ
jgi:hypothetical protein